MSNKKLFYKTAVFILLLMIPQFLFSQIGPKPKISIFPLENREKELQIEVISQNIQKTVEFNLKMINKHNVIQNSVTDYSSDTTWLINYCEKNNLDDLIFGKASIQPNGSVLIEMSVFNREKAATTLTKSEKAETILDIFKAADKLAVEMMDGLSGMHLGFGGIKFINSGEKGKYSVYVDNVFAGENIADLPKVLNGSRSVVITQERMFGNTKIYDKTISIEEEKTVEIGFSVPGFLEKEGDSVSKEEIYIEKNWDSLYSGKNIDKSFDTLFKLLSITDYSKTASEKKKQIEEKFAQWNAKKESMGLKRGLSILDKTFGISLYGAASIIHSEDIGYSGIDLSPMPKFGLAFSVNLSSYFALQTEFAVSIFTELDENNNYSIFENKKFTMFEIPLFIMLRVPPDKVLSIYAGGVFQYHGEMYKEFSEPPQKPYNPAFAAGALFQIPLGSLLFFSFDFRYTKPFTSWIDSYYADLSFDFFHLAFGLGVKF